MILKMVIFRHIAQIDQRQVAIAPWEMYMHTHFFLEKDSIIFRLSKNNNGYTGD